MKPSRTLRSTWHRWTAPAIEEDDIVAALRGLPLHPPRLLLVHGSLSACGRIRGGAATVIRALRAWNAPGALAMPTHTYCYPSAGETCPVFDTRRTQSVVGAISEEFRRQPGVRRSLHPTHSLACDGADAEAIIAGHEDCDTPCGPGTPYERLIERDAAVLMFGATLNAYTFFHTAEDAAAVPYLYESEPVTLMWRDLDGTVREMSMRRQDMSVARRFQEMDGWLQERGLLHRVTLGCGELLLLPHSREVNDAVVERLRADSFFLADPVPAAP